MFNEATSQQGWPERLSTDNDPLYQYKQWKANLHILDIEEIRSLPHAPMSHPFVERLIGRVRRSGTPNSAPTSKARHLSEVFDKEIMLFAHRLQLDADGELEWFTTGDDGREVRVDHEPDTTLWERFNTRILSPIVPESRM